MIINTSLKKKMNNNNKKNNRLVKSLIKNQETIMRVILMNGLIENKHT